MKTRVEVNRARRPDVPDQTVHQALLSCNTLAQGALEMGEMEHLLNVYASRSAPNSIADFVGYAQVGEHEASRRLTEGLWLVRDPCNHDERLFVQAFRFQHAATRCGHLGLCSRTHLLMQAWRFEGGRTLAHYLRRRDCIQRLAEDMDVPQNAVVPTVMRQIFEGLSVRFSSLRCKSRKEQILMLPGCHVSLSDSCM